MSPTRTAKSPIAGGGTGRPPSRPGLVLAWAGVGALTGLALAATFTPLILLLLPAAGAAVLLGRRGGWGTEAFGFVAGLGVLPLVIGWLNRGGPGEVCQGPVDSPSCSDASSPWPWLVLGAALVVGGLLATRSRRRPLA